MAITHAAGPVSSSSAAAALPGGNLQTYQRMFASAVEEDVCCWYFGTLYLRVPGRPDIPVLQAETIMVYRAVREPSVLRLRWTEVGYFRDQVSGKPATDWLNPIIGVSLPTPRTFLDGPGEYTISSSGDGLKVALMQTGANIESVTVDMSVEADRVVLQQTEKKVRALPGKGNPTKATTILTLWSDRAALADEKTPNVPASGSYSFESGGLPAWMGLEGREGTTIVRGIMLKTGTTDMTNSSAWETLSKAFPDFFDGRRVAPRWGEIFKG